MKVCGVTLQKAVFEGSGVVDFSLDVGQRAGVDHDLLLFLLYGHIHYALSLCILIHIIITLVQ